MVSELLYTTIRIGYLALMWIFVIAALMVLRRDVFGTVVIPRGRGRAAEAHTQSQKPKKQREKIFTPRYLVITDGPLTGTTMRLTDAPILVGRSPASTLVIDDIYASNEHARFFRNGGTWFIEDLDSTNGTFVNDVRITEPKVVDQGTVVRIGETTMELSR